MDKQIKKIQKEEKKVGKGLSKLKKMDVKQDKKIDKAKSKMKKGC